jgi:hypothetical protein
MAAELKILEDRNNEIFRTLEEAMTVSVEPLDKMFRKAGLSTDNLLKQVRPWVFLDKVAPSPLCPSRPAGRLIQVPSVLTASSANSMS